MPQPLVRSWYAATATPSAPYPPLDGDVSCDVAIVGGGLTGLTTALELAQRGYDVRLLEAERIGWGATSRNGGHIASAWNKSYGQITRWVGPDDARRLWQLDREAKAIIRDRVARHDIDCDLSWGYLTAALRRRHLADFRETLAEWRGYGPTEARLVGRDELRGMVASPAYLGALWDPDSGQMHPLNYALGLARVTSEVGAKLHEGTRVTALEAGDPAVLTTERGRVWARFVVLAGNAYLAPLSPDMQRVVWPRIMPIATSMIATAPLGAERARALIPANVPVADAFVVLNYYRLSRDHRLLFGGGASYSGVTAPGTQAALRRKMLRYLPQLADVAIDYCWTGLVDISLKRLPHLGRIGANVLFAQGFSGHGLAHTGIAGRVMAEAIAGTAERFDVFARIPHRSFPGGRALRMPALVLGMLWYRLRDVL